MFCQKIFSQSLILEYVNTCYATAVLAYTFLVFSCIRCQIFESLFDKSALIQDNEARSDSFRVHWRRLHYSYMSNNENGHLIIYLCNRNHSNLYILIWFCQKVHNAYVGLKASLWWPVHIIKSVAKHKLSRYTPPQTQHQSFFRDSSPLLVCTRDGFRLWLPLELPAPIKILKAFHVSTDKGKKTFVIVSHSSNFFHHIL